MAMHYSEGELRKHGDADLAKIISGVRDNFQKRHPGIIDIALPGSEVTDQRQLVSTGPSAARHLVFRGDGTEGDVLTTTASGLEAQGNNLGTLQQRIHEVIAPYYFLFLDKLPFSQKGLVGLLTRNRKAVTKWTNEERIKDLQMRYEYQLGYRKNPDKNQLEYVRLALGSQHDQSDNYNKTNISPGLEIHFDNGQISQIRIFSSGRVGKALLRLTRDNALGKFLRESIREQSDNSLGGSYTHLVTFLLKDAPMVIIQEIYPYYMADGSTRVTEMEKIQFDGEKNVFVRYGISDRKSKSLGMTTDEFMGILESTLALIPTVDLNGR
ncbi:MAG: hypothetical protein HYV39_02550 [Candidatus Levybacteria bacterium]|nr:hypothetical protein [Candidatus Levybacteria bacterium]